MSDEWIPRYAIIPTHNRREQLTQLVTTLRDRCDVTVIIDNASQPAITPEWFVQRDEQPASSMKIIIVRDDEQPPNLSRLWNVGFDVIAAHAAQLDVTRWDVAILNDDTVLPGDWYDAVSLALRDHLTAVVACGATTDHVCAPILHTDPHNGSILTRMTPWAFIIRGELNVRADESLHWWWGDTDLDWQARQLGGVLIIPGYVALNTLANSTTHGVLAEQAARDGETFRQKWGWRPW